MSEHDESLEMGIAAGLDVPTAMVISKRPDERPTGKCYSRVVLAVVIVGVLALVVAYLL